jgi:hypothetical protein
MLLKSLLKMAELDSNTKVMQLQTTYTGWNLDLLILNYICGNTVTPI